MAELSSRELGLETVRLQENLSYSVTVRSDQTATDRFRAYLRDSAKKPLEWALRDNSIAASGVPSPRDQVTIAEACQRLKEVEIRLESLIALTTNPKESYELRKILNLLNQPKMFTLRVHLNGALKRPVC